MKPLFLVLFCSRQLPCSLTIIMLSLLMLWYTYPPTLPAPHLFNLFCFPSSLHPVLFTLPSSLYPLSLIKTITYHIMDKDPSIKAVQSKGAAIEHSSGGRIPYADRSTSVLSNRRYRLRYNSGSPNMFCRQQEDGIRSPRTGKQTQPSWQRWWLGSRPWCGVSALIRRYGQASQKRGDSFQVDGESNCGRLTSSDGRVSDAMVW